MDLPNYTIKMDENERKKKKFEGKIKSFVLILTTKKQQPFMAMKIFL